MSDELTIKQILDIKKKIQMSELIRKSKLQNHIAFFNNIPLYPGMDLSLFSESELDLYHVFLHSLFVKKNPSLPKHKIKQLHNELLTKLSNHRYFDELDD